MSLGNRKSVTSHCTIKRQVDCRPKSDQRVTEYGVVLA